MSLETSTLSGWVGATTAALKPLIDALAAGVLYRITSQEVA